MTVLEPAKAIDIDLYMRIITDAKNFQNEQGFTQWTDDYPNADTLRGDIQGAKGYALITDGQIAGYVCVDFDGEPAYNDIRGSWHANRPYAVVHRLALKREFRGMGLSEIAFRKIEELCSQKGVGYIRVDTDHSNRRMQHVLQKNGFAPCGSVVFQGGEKLAFDKLLQQ